MSGRETLAITALAGAFFLILWLPSLSPHYGFYSDELYYLACAKRLALGYVDQPPFSILVLRLSEALLGDSLFSVRALAAAAGPAPRSSRAGWRGGWAVGCLPRASRRWR